MYNEWKKQLRKVVLFVSENGSIHFFVKIVRFSNYGCKKGEGAFSDKANKKEKNIPWNPVGHLQANVFTGEMARKRIDSVAKKSDAFPNLSTERHSSKFKHGSRTQRLSSKGST